MTAGSEPLPRSVVAVGIDPDLRGSLARHAAGRSLVIDAFRSFQWGTWVGDLIVEWHHGVPEDRFVALQPLEDVPVYAERALLGLLRLAGPTLVGSRLPLLGGIGVTLERPELWIEFLEDPSAFQDDLPSVPSSGSKG